MNIKIDIKTRIKNLNKYMLEMGVLKLPQDIYHPLALLDDTKKIYEAQFKHGIPLEWDNFMHPDGGYYYSVAPGEITLIGGVPSGGKSTFLNCIITSTASAGFLKWAIFSPETGAPAKIHRKLVEAMTRKTYTGRWGSQTLTWQEVESATKHLKDKVFYLYPEKPKYETIFSQAKFLSQSFGVNALVIDPLNEVLPYREKDTKEDEYISLFLANARKLCDETGIHFFLVAHPTKEAMTDKMSGEEKAPSAVGMKGAMELYSKPDNIIIVGRDKDRVRNKKQEVKVYIKKCRNQDMGVGCLGEISLYYNTKTGRLIDKPIVN